MGTIYRNGVPFVGSGGAGGVEMTQAEYDLLPTSEKMNGAIYFITDGDVSYPSASQMRYDNTESQIPATTVQGAIDENRIEINDLKTGLTVQEGTLTGGTNVTLIRPSCYKFGRMVVFSAVCQLSANLTGSGTLLNLPFTPARQFDVVGHIGTSWASPKHCALLTVGNALTRNDGTLSSGDYVWVSGAYLSLN